MRLCRSGSGQFCLTLLVSTLFVMVLGIVLPTTAWASDGEEGTTGFLAGLETLVNPDSAREVDNDPVRDYEYVPVLMDEGLLRDGSVEDPSEVSVLDKISAFFTTGFRFSWDGADINPVKGTRGLIKLFGLIVPTAIGLVFFWWGVRKVIHMIFAAFRSGRMTVGGYDVNPNSYYFGTRANDWR